MLSKNKKSLDSGFSSDILEMKKLINELENSWKAIGDPKIEISKSTFGKNFIGEISL